MGRAAGRALSMTMRDFFSLLFAQAGLRGHRKNNEAPATVHERWCVDGGEATQIALWGGLLVLMNVKKQVEV